jgi:cytoskeletal protein RodZ
MSESLGAKLRQLREAQELTREQLYARTKIMPKYIEALENGRWDLLPGQMYVRPFVKSLADVLGANANELYALIDKQEIPVVSPTPVSIRQPQESSRRVFDYRWLVVAGMLAVAILVILAFRSYTNQKDIQTLKSNMSSIVPKPAGYTRSHKYSAKLDFQPKLLSIADYRYLELTAREPVKLTLTAASDTLFKGILETGKTIKNKSTKAMALNLQKADCLDIVFDGQKMNDNTLVKYKNYIVFPGSDLIDTKTGGAKNAGE